LTRPHRFLIPIYSYNLVQARVFIRDNVLLSYLYLRWILYWINMLLHFFLCWYVSAKASFNCVWTLHWSLLSPGSQWQKKMFWLCALKILEKKWLVFHGNYSSFFTWRDKCITVVNRSAMYLVFLLFNKERNVCVCSERVWHGEINVKLL